MSLTPENMQKLIVQLEALCTEARTLQERIKQAMADRARGDLPDRSGQPDRRSTPRKRR